ncbi:tyrosine-type recombinase/integrase [Butyrivibrio hungatei]|uniref:tyrosine-type recombinase/integrase n=1 Tax=Butyrivibrio hungatei TaxID=185008 RepID=UPI0004052A5D|nr:tyrosine-type recombinase/integrase [Butyrivibrio hungatei]
MVKSEMECLVDAFIEYLKSVKDYSENTVGSYKHDALLFVRFLEERGVHNITEVTEDIISEYQALLKEKKMAVSTIVRYNTTIKNFFAFLVENGNIPDNPAEVIKSPSVSVSKKTPRILSDTETLDLLNQEFSDSPKGVRDKAILEMLYSTGLKVSEIISLKLSNIDMGLGCIILPKMKSEEGDRVIPYGKMTRSAVTSYLLEARKALLGKREDKGYVFLNCDGKQLSRQGVWKIVKFYAQKAGVSSDISPHSLRHSFAAHLVKNGAEISAIQDMMGFSPSNTLSKYVNKENTPKDPYEWARIR